MSKPTRPSKVSGYLDVETWDALKAAGYTDEQLSEDTGQIGPVVFAYTRSQAIADGMLVDVTHLARVAGFTLHTAMTCGLVAEVTDGSDGPRFRDAAILAVLQMLREAIRRQDRKSDRIHFDVANWKLWACVGPGDNGEPVLTIMMENED